jgi:hypothetical protein
MTRFVDKFLELIVYFALLGVVAISTTMGVRWLGGQVEATALNALYAVLFMLLAYALYKVWFKVSEDTHFDGFIGRVGMSLIGVVGMFVSVLVAFCITVDIFLP